MSTAAKSNVILVAVLSAIVAGIVGLGVGAGATWAVMRSGPGVSGSGPGAASSSERVPMTREEFRAKVRVGMTKDEVIAAIGKPDRTVEVGGTSSWVYSSITIDALTNRVDPNTGVTFGSNGLVRSLGF